MVFSPIQPSCSNSRDSFSITARKDSTVKPPAHSLCYALEWTRHLTPPVTWEAPRTNAAPPGGCTQFTNAASLPPTNDFYRTRQVP